MTMHKQLLLITILLVKTCAHSAEEMTADNAAQIRAEATPCRAAARALSYSQKQREELQKLNEQLNIRQGSWPQTFAQRKQLIMDTIEQYALHPDDIWLIDYGITKTLLIDALFYNDITYFKFLLKHGARPHEGLLNIATGYKYVPDFVRLLIEHNVDVAKKGFDYRTALEALITCGPCDVARAEPKEEARKRLFEKVRLLILAGAPLDTSKQLIQQERKKWPNALGIGHLYDLLENVIEDAIREKTQRVIVGNLVMQQMEPVTGLPHDLTSTPGDYAAGQDMPSVDNVRSSINVYLFFVFWLYLSTSDVA